MILILSKSKLEQSTDEVIEWLDSNGCNYKRINGDDPLATQYELSNDFLDNTQERLTNVNVVWYRRWRDLDDSVRFISDLKIGNEGYYTIRQHLHTESFIMDYFKLNSFKCENWIPKRGKASINKLRQLEIARDLGILIPESLITCSKESLEKFQKKYTTIITKPLSDVFTFSEKDEMYTIQTEKITDEFLKTLPNTFGYSLFQEYIEKEFEIRTFVIGQKIFSMAIFSQSDEKTQVDFRNYNWKKPNRTIPFQLPSHLEIKILKFMEVVDLNTGSFDFIKVKEADEYVFLEVNPVGQFGMVSKPCNYYIEKFIAQYLQNQDIINEK